MVSVTLTCTVSDYYHALLWRHLRRWDAWVVPVAGIIFVVWKWRGGEQLLLSVAQAISVAIAVTFTLLTMPYYSARSIAKRIGFAIPTTLTLSDEGVVIENAHGHSTIGWILVQSVPETPHCFLFRFTSDGFFVVPKRQLAAEQTAALRQILLDHKKLV